MKFFLLLFLMFGALYADIGVVSSIVGDVKVSRGDTQTVLNISDEILEKDLILTQGKSRLQVILKDKTVITIGPNSEFSFDEYLLDEKNSKLNFQARKGFFKAVSGQIGKFAPQRFKIKTRSATIGIRGTIFMGEIEENYENIACLKGAITIDTVLKSVLVPSGEMVIIKEQMPHQKKINFKEFKDFRKFKPDKPKRNNIQDILDQANTQKVNVDLKGELSVEPTTTKRPENLDQIGPLN